MHTSFYFLLHFVLLYYYIIEQRFWGAYIVLASAIVQSSLNKYVYTNNCWYVGYFQVDNRQVKLFLFEIQYARSQRRKWWCYGVGPSVNISFPEHISGSTCPIVFKFYTQHLQGV